ncbi:MAG: hypothetical protein V4604_05390 [Bacteroidota bacterium]
MNSINEKIEKFHSLNDIHQYRILLDATDEFISSFPNGVLNDKELDLGIKLFKDLIGLSYINSLREYEHDHKLYREILQKKIRVFKLCIPETHEKLRGLTEMLVGMKENELG